MAAVTSSENALLPRIDHYRVKRRAAFPNIHVSVSHNHGNGDHTRTEKKFYQGGN